jgi:protein-S-isoprenylcysteine O-methyltransferase Ste14
MANLIKNQKGMNIVGQGGKIIIFMLPSLILSVWAQKHLLRIAMLPESFDLLRTLGYILIVPGIILWGSAVIQLTTGFSKGYLLKTGAYGIVRNPIYSSAVFFILPAISLMTLTWIYLVPAFFLYIGVQIFISKEEQQLLAVFGSEYRNYLATVDRLVPFRKPK